MISPNEARELARRAVELTAADEAEALVASELSSLTRFANNRISQNVTEDNTAVSVRAVLGKRIGVASTNRIDDASLAECCEAAVAAAAIAPEDPQFPGLPSPRPPQQLDRASMSTSAYDAMKRAEAVRSIVAPSLEQGLTAAGTVATAEHVIAIANSRGVSSAMATSGLRSTVLAMGESGSGWASFTAQDADDYDPAALGAEAADIAVRSADPGDLEPGDYTVVLAPECVADLMDFLSYVGFSARAFAEGRSFLTDKLGEKLMSDNVTIVDDALAPWAMGLTFDYEGVAKQATPLIENGVAIQPVTDSYWAAVLERENTGHGLPAPNSFGPLPLNISMAAGDATLEELIGSVKRGVYVTRFHYVNVEDPVPATLTGMTRDGTFMIENGQLARPLKNLRFTQSAVEALAHCEGITRNRRFVGTEEGASYVPGILCSKFAFTGQTA